MKTGYRGIFLMLCLLLLTGCAQKAAKPGDVIHTALFDFSITEGKAVEQYPGIEAKSGYKLVQMQLWVHNTSDQTYTMFSGDFQLQWGEGDEDFGTCLPALDSSMVPYAYQLAPDEEYTGLMLVEVPDDCSMVTVAYQEQLANGEMGDAYFAEVPL